MHFSEYAIALTIAIASTSCVLGYWLGYRSARRVPDPDPIAEDFKANIQRLRVDAMALGMLLVEWEHRFGSKDQPLTK